MNSRSQMWNDVLASHPDATPPLVNANSNANANAEAIADDTIAGFPPPQPVNTTTSLAAIEKSKQPITAGQRVRIIIESKVLVACIVAIIVVLLLVVVNPPLAQSSDKPGKRSALKIGTWALAFGLLAFVIPTGASLFCQSSNASVPAAVPAAVPAPVIA